MSAIRVSISKGTLVHLRPKISHSYTVPSYPSHSHSHPPFSRSHLLVAVLLQAMSANNDRNVPHSQPIPIHHRSRSHSVSEVSSSSESSSPHSPISPVNSPLSSTQPRIAPLSPTAPGVLNYFLSQSPKSPTNTFPFRRGFAPVVFEGALHLSRC